MEYSHRTNCGSSRNIPMTRLVNGILENAVSEMEQEQLENITHIDREYNDEKVYRDSP